MSVSFKKVRCKFIYCFRTVFLRLASLTVLMATLYHQVTCAPVDSCNVGIPPDCPKLEVGPNL